MKFANKLTTKAMLAVALLGVGGATISAIQHKTGDNVAHADTPVRRYYEYRRIRGRLYYRSVLKGCLLYTSPSPRDGLLSRMPSSA